MLNQLASVVSGAGSGQTFMAAYRDLFGALAGFPETGGTAAAANVARIAADVSTQARELGVPACAPT